MGVDKRFVEVGGVGLLETILRKASAIDFVEKFLCVEDELPALKDLATKYGVRLLVDEIKNVGPLSAISRGLGVAKTDWNFAVSADMPFFEFDAVSTLTENFRRCKRYCRKSTGERNRWRVFIGGNCPNIFDEKF